MEVAGQEPLSLAKTPSALPYNDLHHLAKSVPYTRITDSKDQGRSEAGDSVAGAEDRVANRLLALTHASRIAVAVHRVPWPTLKGIGRDDSREIVSEINARIAAHRQRFPVFLLPNQARRA